jgi:hypothetical protein
MFPEFRQAHNTLDQRWWIATIAERTSESPILVWLWDLLTRCVEFLPRMQNDDLWRLGKIQKLHGARCWCSQYNDGADIRNSLVAFRRRNSDRSECWNQFTHYGTMALRWTKWRWARFSPSTSVSPASLHFTNFSTITITYHPGLVQ